jgi:DNA primase
MAMTPRVSQPRKALARALARGYGACPSFVPGSAGPELPSGRSAEEIVPRHPADLAWMANLACLELHPHSVRAEDLEHPDELRVDLDPVPGVAWPQIVQVWMQAVGVANDHAVGCFRRSGT